MEAEQGLMGIHKRRVTTHLGSKSPHFHKGDGIVQSYMSRQRGYQFRVVLVLRTELVQPSVSCPANPEAIGEQRTLALGMVTHTCIPSMLEKAVSLDCTASSKPA